MDRFKKIMVPIDGKKGSYECFRLACHIGLQNNSEIHVVYIINLNAINKAVGVFNEDQEKIIKDNITTGESYFKKYISTMKSESPHQFKFITRILKARNLADEIIDYAQKSKMDLIIMNLVPKRDAKEMLLGHITLRVAEFAKIPVLVMPHTAE